MSVTQQQYFDAIGRAGLVWSDAVLANINLEKTGCSPKWNTLLCQMQQIESAEYFLSQADYASSTNSALMYQKMLAIAGSQYSNAFPDPNAQTPGVTVIISGVGGGRAVKVVMDPSTTNLTKTYLNTTYPYNTYQEGDIVYVPAAFLQYTKLENSVNSDWNEEPFNYAG